MKKILGFIFRSAPLSVGIIICLTALSFLINFTEYASLEEINSSDFLTFFFLSIIGIPTLLFGINKITEDS